MSFLILNGSGKNKYHYKNDHYKDILHLFIKISKMNEEDLIRIISGIEVNGVDKNKIDDDMIEYIIRNTRPDFIDKYSLLFFDRININN